MIIENLLCVITLRQPIIARARREDPSVVLLQITVAVLVVMLAVAVGYGYSKYSAEVEIYCTQIHARTNSSLRLKDAVRLIRCL